MTPRFTLNQRWLWTGTTVLSLLLLITLVGDLNRPMFHIGNSLSLYTGEWIWSNITLFGDTLIIFALLLPFIGKRPELIWAVLLSACIVVIPVQLSKEFIDSVRPAGLLPLDELHLIGYVARHSSFPSGHTAAAFTFASALALMPVARRWKVAAVLAATLVGISRIAVGIHWPLDVLGGALVGWFGTAMGCYLAARLPFGMGTTAQKIEAGLLILLTLISIAMHDGGYPQGRILIITLSLAMLLLAAPGIKQLFFNAPANNKP